MARVSTKYLLRWLVMCILGRERRAGPGVAGPLPARHHPRPLQENRVHEGRGQAPLLELQERVPYRFGHPRKLPRNLLEVFPYRRLVSGAFKQAVLPAWL